MAVPQEKAQLYRELLTRRSRREPLAYILGEWDFMGLSFEVSKDVLIPEQDTENLIEEIMRESCDGERILDLCTGSGCILLSLLNYSNGTTGVGTDLSEKAIAVASRNAERLGLSDRTELRCGDLFGPIRPDERFDIIVSNPPYIRSGIIEQLAPEVSVHEPRMALDGGDDGLFFYRRIIPEAAGHLVTGGILFLEIGYDQADAVKSLMREAGYYDVRSIKDYGGNDRIVCGIKSIHQN
jgi:release factor glutamine methyltransferase